MALTMCAELLKFNSGKFKIFRILMCKKVVCFNFVKKTKFLGIDCK